MKSSASRREQRPDCAKKRFKRISPNCLAAYFGYERGRSSRRWNERSPCGRSSRGVNVRLPLSPKLRSERLPPSEPNFLPKPPFCGFSKRPSPREGFSKRLSERIGFSKRVFSRRSSPRKRLSDEKLGLYDARFASSRRGALAVRPSLLASRIGRGLRSTRSAEDVR